MLQTMPGTPGEPLLLMSSVLGSCRALHSTRDLHHYVPSEGRSSNSVKCMLKCQEQNSNPHTTDQKHKSSSPVRLTTKPRHPLWTFYVLSVFLITNLFLPFRAFWKFSEHFRSHADKLFQSLDPSKQKAVQGEMSSASSSGSLSSKSLSRASSSGSQENVK